jgi:hypothetical protein
VYEKNIDALQRDLVERENAVKRLEIDVRNIDNRDTKIEALGN